MSRRPLIAVVLLVSGCAGYDPPMTGDHGAARYQADLQRCQKQANAAATKIANSSPQSAVRAAFTSSEPERQQVRDCMVSKGYKLAS